MKELIQVRVQYASRQQCCKTHKRPLPFAIHKSHLTLREETKHISSPSGEIFEIFREISKYLRKYSTIFRGTRKYSLGKPGWETLLSSLSVIK